MMQPISVWCTLPLLAHLQSFAAPVAAQLAPAADAGPGAAIDTAATPPAQQQADSGSRISSSKAAVAAAISDILQERQQGEQQQHAGAQPAMQPALAPAPPAPLRLSLYLPAACVVAAVPGLDPSLPKYFAAEARGSSSRLLASVAPRLGSQAAEVREGGRRAPGC